jgi:peptidoglycan/xylan/chitin deacetylase (PgdA/CDA1 family)
MDPDSANACFPYKLMELVTSQMAKTTIATVVFTSCYYYETDTDVKVSTVNFLKPDTAVIKLNNAGAPKKKKKTIYLTFDDGPNKGTKNMMDIVQDEEIPVTVFIVGEHVYGSAAQTAIFDSLVTGKYFEIANHSFTHAFKNQFAKFYQVPDSVVNDFKRCADSLHLTANIIRTPGRNIWRTKLINQTDINSSKAAADSLFTNGYIIAGWDLEWHYDSKLKLTNTNGELRLQIDSMFTNAKTKTPGHLVLLAHDQVYEDPADSMELRQFIIKLKATNEYNFEPVSRYPFLKN